MSITKSRPKPAPLQVPAATNGDSLECGLTLIIMNILSHAVTRSRPAWIPIRSLGSANRARITAHLLRLDEQDRHLRFGYPASDEQIARYVETIDFQRDEVFGIFDRRLRLIAVAHLAHPGMAPFDEGTAVSEFGVSVLDSARGRGIGQRLFDHAVLHARNRGIDTLLIHALSENTAMLKIAQKAGAVLERDKGESEALLKLPPDTLASHVGEIVEQQAAELDFQWKRHAWRFAGFLRALQGRRPADEFSRDGRQSPRH